MNEKELSKKLLEAGQALCWNAEGTAIGAQFLARLFPSLKFVPGLGTAGVSTEGLSVDPEWAAGLSLANLAAIEFHETFHVLAGHLDQLVELGIARRSTTNPGSIETVAGKEVEARWANIAQDVVINELIAKLKIGRLPEGCVYATTLTEMSGGKAYSGPMVSEDIYRWIVANVERPQQPPPPPEFGKGCSPTGLPAGIDAVAVEQMRAAAREAAIGTGSMIAEALAPRAAKVDWRKVLKNAVESSEEANDQTERSFARPSRRTFPDIIVPGLIGTESRVAVIVDVSGSVGPEWAAKAAGYIEKLGTDFPGVGIFLATHTDVLTWSGWVVPGQDRSAITDSLKFTGGTDAAPAYDAVRATKARFDAVIHFTDCELPAWPACPARKLIVGVLCQSTVPGGLPPGAKAVLVAN